MKNVWIAVVVIAAVLVGYTIWARQAPEKATGATTERNVRVMSTIFDPLKPGPEGKCVASYQYMAPSAGTPCFDNLFSKPRPDGKYYDLTQSWGCRFKGNFPADNVCPEGSEKVQEQVTRYYCVSDSVNVGEMTFPCAASNNATYRYDDTDLDPRSDAKDEEMTRKHRYVAKCQMQPGTPRICVSSSGQGGAGPHPSGNSHDVCCLGGSVDTLILTPREKGAVPEKVKAKPAKTRVAP